MLNQVICQNIRQMKLQMLPVGMMTLLCFIMRLLMLDSLIMTMSGHLYMTGRITQVSY